ncbi:MULTISPECIES: exodeoxyribonuclease VII small subunit [unclassified Breznakia]|uniref:exodeoxyribonuclease VII small subunit n=1 Tax=unclassified Breznakia TaxID=2623764 RepID=UPI002476753C|nr:MULTISPECIES: exodeoxyribonuclease VII small subunit [unclassified Breznakia]MDH6366358.1 exodeoxyribonuclease VII small subunit [Breznakia sp. PH1-1]MDH6403451.1 exodeoxyribonuclease VII small subunit [Breznakia sp. PF1-11]MDH6411160.1 exodeoxyribonuclease VII small subunit [Breznakia sp. PFB1-11]MDH6413577.1 exodeoxyribonuclease VII small subunit [Breznakia sp. PFB1-14]MDH6415705.1 exodeoxyribonuclease VII small subunit [Breznakia sp. PFB1-4]
MESKMTFRERMNRLDTVVSQLERNEVELEDAIDLLKEALLIVKSCDEQLQGFEEQVSQLIAEEVNESEATHE